MSRLPALPGASSFVRLAALGVACSTALALTASMTVEPADAAVRKARKVTAISVDARSNLGAVKQGVLGVNHRFVGSGHGMWDGDADTGSPDPVAVKRLRMAGVGPVRYPGGIVGNLFDWKESIGPGASRDCQTSGRWTPNGFARARGLAYGIDEHMEFVDAINGSALMMVPFATETPSDAADWVEYMNSPADGPDGSNPNGGVDWADVRESNGHPGRYNVRLWEIGNEHRVLKQRYWMSQNERKARRQYAFGGTRVIRNEALGKNCRHPNIGVRSNGNRTTNQVFQLLYPPAAPDSVTVSVGASPESWTEVESLETAGPDDQVFTVNETEGLVTFGHGENGAVLPQGVRVSATYRSTHRGVFAFIKAMKQVDPKINACVTWGKKEFVGIARGRRYDCFSVHAYTHFRAERARNWRNAIQGHDRHMLGARSERSFVAEIKRALPRGKPIALTEFGAIWGNTRVYPEWMASMTHATYMASMWVSWLEMGIPWATGSDMLAPSHRGLLGRAPHFAYSAEALTRQAIRPLFHNGVRRLRVGIARNPIRNPHIGGRTYPALMAGATRARNGDLHILVVNRLPSAGQRVRARLNLARFRSRGVAFVSRVNGASFRSWNGPRNKEVRLKRGRQRVRRNQLTHVFPPHSVTVFRIPSR
jgi:alpha-L-arabinofuranosidase